MSDSLARKSTCTREARRRSAAVLSTFAMIGTALMAVPASTAQAAISPTTVQVSVATGGFAPGQGGNGGGQGTERRLLSDDGRYVVFESSGPVVPGQLQLDWQIVRRDRHLGTTTLISKSTAGVKGNGRSGHPSVSADGQVVAFHSYASNLVAGDTNSQSDIFIHDVRTGTTTRASVNSAGAQVAVSGGTNIVGPPSISASGRHVGFTSHAQGLTSDDTAQTNAYLHDRQTRTIEVVSRSVHSLVVDAMASSPVSPSADGSVVAFHSGNANVVASDTNSDPDTFIRDRTLATTTMISAGQDGSNRHSMTPNAQFVVFESSTENLVTGDNNGKVDIFVKDRVSGITERISVASGGTQANGSSRYASISRDGRYVTFLSDATNLVAGDANGHTDAFRRDRSTGQTIRVSVAANGAQNPLPSRSPAISGDGQHVVFESHGSTLTGVATKSWSQVFVRDLVGKWPALHARLSSLPARVNANAIHRVATRDILAGPALAITWTPTGKTTGAVVRQSAAITGNTFSLRSHKRFGRYVVTVKYGDNTVGSRTIEILKPTAKKLPKAIKRGKKFKVKTIGVNQGQIVQFTFKPKGKTKGKTIKRSTKVNKSGVVTVKSASRRGTYQVTVRTHGKILRKDVVRIR